MEATQMSIDRWMDKEDMGHMYNGMLFSRKKNKIMPFVCRNMDGPRDDHTKWSKSERERQTPYDITSYVESEIGHKWTYLETDSQTGDRMDYESGVSRYTLLYREQINKGSAV